MSTRPKIPTNIEAQVLYNADHICSICHDTNLSVQIHHIDGNNKNNKENNLMVLCLEHHNKANSKSTMSKSFTVKELKKYKKTFLKFLFSE